MPPAPHSSNETSLRRHVGSGLRWGAVGKLLGQLMSWASTLVVIRLLSPTDYGLIAMAAVFINFCGMINEFGLGMTLIQRSEVTGLMKRQVWTVTLVANVGFLLIFYAAAEPIAVFYDEPELIPIVQIMALQFPIRALSVVANAMLIRSMRFKEIAMVDLVSQIANVIVTLTLAFLSFGYWSIIIGSLVEAGVKALYYMYLDDLGQPITFQIRGIRSLVTTGGAFSVNRILWFVFAQADKLILGRLLGSDRLGVYAVGSQLASLPLDKSGGILNQVAFPAYTKLQADPTRAYGAYLKTVDLILFFLVPICFGVASVADEAIHVVLGANWSNAALPLAFISVITPLKLVAVSYTNLLNGVGKVLLVTRNLALACIIVPASLIIGAQKGLYGVCLAWVLSYIAWYALTHYLTGKAMNWPFRQELARLVPATFAGAAMFATVELGFSYVASPTLTPFASLALKIPVGVLSYLLYWLLLNGRRVPYYRTEIMSFLR